MTSSISISSATSLRSRPSQAGRWPCWSIHLCPPRPFRSSSLMPRPIRARSTWHPLELELLKIRLGQVLHRLGRRRSGRDRLPRPLRVPRRHHQQPHRQPRRRGRHHPPQARKSYRWRMTRMSGHEFTRRFLQHVLPKGLHKIRYYGLWHPARREHADRARLMLLSDRPTTPGPATRSAETSDRAADRSANHNPSDETRICPCCQQRRLVRVGRLSRNRPADHDPSRIAATIITALVPACADQATADLCLPFARLRLVAPKSPPPPRMTPPDHLDGALPRPRPFDPTGKSEPPGTSAQLKIP